MNAHPHTHTHRHPPLSSSAENVYHQLFYAHRHTPSTHSATQKHSPGPGWARETPQIHKLELQPFPLASPTFYLTFPSPPHLSCPGQSLALGNAPQAPRRTLLLPMEERVTVSLVHTEEWV